MRGLQACQAPKSKESTRPRLVFPPVLYNKTISCHLSFDDYRRLFVAISSRFLRASVYNRTELSQGSSIC